MPESAGQAKLLHDFFKSLGEVDEDSKMWTAYHGSVNKILQPLLEFIGNKCGLIRPRLYGSSAENLKIYSFDDVGDLDVLFILGEDLIVDENVLEYLPVNPAYAKIRGADGHPLSEAFLAEDKEYISASDIKVLYPFLDMYVMVSKLLYRLVKAITPRSSVSLLNYSVRERATDSPALTLDNSVLMASYDVLSRLLEQFKQLNFQNLDSSELELIPVALCTIARVDYTPEQAEVFDDFVQHFKDSVQSLRSYPWGIIQGIPNFAREIWSSEKAKEIRNRFCNIESGSEIERGSKPENNSTMAVTPEVEAVDENENRSSECKQVDQSISFLDLTEEELLEQLLAVQVMEECVGGKDDNSHDSSKANFQGNERVSKSDIYQNQNLRQEQTGGFFSNATLINLSEEAEKSFIDWLLKEKAEDFIDFLDTLEPIQEAQFPASSDESQTCRQSLSFDIVPALQARGWPKVAREWINRRRKWPSPDTIRRIEQEGFHLVVKPPKSCGCPETDFRLSFSHAEYLLSKELNDIQRDCYRGLKKYYSVYLRTEPKCLATYHLKTILLQTCEETGSEMWTEENTTACMMKLLGNLHSALQNKYLRHFFVTACNLFDVENIENPHCLDSLAVKVEHFMRNPMKFSPELIPAQGTRKPKEVPLTTNREATTKQGQYEGASIIEDTLPRNDPKQSRQLATTNEENERSTSPEPTRKLSGTAKDAISMHTSRETRTTSLEGARFHELEVLYIRACLELLSVAAEDGSMEELDPLERSLVEDIRELTSVYNVHSEELMAQFKSQWQQTYIWMFLNCEFTTKQSMLAAMKNNMKLIKHMVLQDGFLGSPRDYSLILSPDALLNLYKRMKRILSSMEQKQPVFNMEDIPLD